MVCVVIMAGGKGERFWPKSRVNKPKQFTDLTGKGSMLLLTYRRIMNFADSSRIFVVTGQDYKDLTKESLPDIPEENIIIEPDGRNTAPCIGLAAAIIDKKYPGSTMVVLPADHLVKDENLFCRTLETAAALAENTRGLVTLGIRPTRPETGFGYLKVGEEYKAALSQKVYKVAEFVEKPNLEKAKGFLTEGGYLWNGGIFIWKVEVILKAFEKYLPEIYRGLIEIKQAIDAPDFEITLSREYSKMEKVSIDYGIMEKSDEVYTVPGEFDWDDVGTWGSLERIFEKDQNGNILLGKVIALDTKNTIADAGQRLVAVVGAEDLIIVDTEDVTLICHKEKAPLIRELLEELRSQKLEKHL